MTGTIDLSAEQLSAIHADTFDDDVAFRPSRVVIHPERDGAVRVVTVRVGDDVVAGTRYVLRDGTVLTGYQYRERV